MALKLIDTRSGKTYSGSGNTSSGRAPSWSSSSGKLNLVKTPGYVFNDPQVVYGDKRPDRIGASAPKLQFEEPIEIGLDFNTQMSRLQELRRQAAVDLDTALVDRLDKQMQALRTSAGKQTVGDRGNDILSSALSSSVGSMVNAAGVGANAVIDPERIQRNLTRLQETLDKGYTTDGQKLNDAQKETLRQSIADLQKQLEKSQSKDSIQNKLYEAADKMTQDSAKFQSQAKQGLGALGQFGVDVAIGGLQLAGDIGLGAVTGLGAMAPIAVRGFGSGAQEARQDGATLGQQMAYGIGSAAVEALTEKLSSVGVLQKTAFGAPILKNVDDMLEGVVAAIERAGKTEAGKAILNRLASAGVGFLSEGTEEMISGLVNPVLKKATYSDEAIDWKQTWDDALYEFLVGGAIGAIGGGIGGTDTARSVDKASAASYNMNQTTVSPAAAPQVQQMQQMAQEERITRAVDPEAEVLSAGATLYTELGMRPNRAKEKAEIVQRLVAGEKVDVKDINKLNLTDKAYRAVFTQLTGVQFPEGRLSNEQVQNLARSAGQEAAAVKEAAEIQQEQQEKAFQEAAQAQVEQLEQESVAGETVSFSEFMDVYRAQVDPKVTREEAARQYEQYLNDAAERQAGATEKQRFVQTLRSAPGGDQLSDAEIEELYAQTQSAPRVAQDAVRYEGKKYTRADLKRMLQERSGDPNQVTDDTVEQLFVDLRARETEQVKKSVNEWKKVLVKTSSVTDIVLDDTLADNEHGYIDGQGVIHLNARHMDSADAVAYVLGHELVHSVKDDAARKALVEDIIETMTRLGMTRGVSRDEAVRQYQERYQNHENEVARRENRQAQTISLEYAEEEYAADLMREVFLDGDMLNKLAAEKPSLLARVQEILRKWIASLKGNQDAVELYDELNRLQDRLVEAMKTDAAQKRFALETAGLEVDTDTDSARHSLYSLTTWTESDYVLDRDKAAAALAKSVGVSEEKARKYIDDVNSIAKLIADDKARLDYDAAPGRSSFVGNSEYGGSIDFSTICKKRRLFTGTFSAIQKALPNTALTPDEMIDIRKRMKAKGYEVSCGLCYVEGSRLNLGQYATQFLDQYADGDVEYVPGLSELTTVDGQENLRREHPEAYEAYMKFLNTLAQRKPKVYQTATAYNGEVLKKFSSDSSVSEKNANGGLRLQSFSDFEIVHLIDNMQVITDMARVGLAGQAYTKVPDFAWAMGKTGLKINLSLIAKDVDAEGRLVLDDVEGMPRSDAEALRSAYSDHVGTVIVVFNDAQLKAAMADDFIDYIIPFHRSQLSKKQYDGLGLPEGAKDYTMVQNEAYIEPVLKNGKKQRPSNYMPNNYWDFSKTGKENAEAYLEMCAKNNRRPKFSNVLEYNGDGSYSLPVDGSADGYWKLLIDFKMYNNEGVGVPQQPVKPEFNMEQAERMLSEYKGGHSGFPVAQDVVDEFVADYKRSHPDNRFSLAYEGTDDPELQARLSVAKRQLLNGAPPETVRANTGWWKNARDGMWRFEIDDSQMAWRIKNLDSVDSVNGIALDQLIDHDKLFASYPHLRGYTVMFDLDPTKTGGAGAHRASSMVIRLERDADLRNPEVKKALAHEMQHAVQYYERNLGNAVQAGFSPRGGYQIGFIKAYRSLSGRTAFNLLPYKLKVQAIESVMARTGRKILSDRYSDAESNVLGLAQYYYTTALGEIEAEQTARRVELTELERVIDEAPAEYNASHLKSLKDSNREFRRVLKRLGWSGVDKDLPPVYNRLVKDGELRENRHGHPTGESEEAARVSAQAGEAQAENAGFVVDDPDGDTVPQSEALKASEESGAFDLPAQDAYARYSIANPELSFADQVDLVRQNKLNEFLTPGTSGRNPHVLTNSAVYVAKEPNPLMQELGYGDLAIVVTQDHLRQMMGKREDADGNVIDEHSHQLTPRQVKILPKLLEKPAAVLRAKGRPESLIFVTTEKDYRGRPIIVPIKANGVEVVYDGISGPAHVVTSMYGRDNFDTFFENAVKQGQLVYYKKERIDPILTAPGYQSSGLLSGIDSGTIVGEVNPVVKDPGQRKYAITPEFEEWYLRGYTDPEKHEQVRTVLEELKRKHGEIPAGETPVRDVRMPRANKDGKRVHDTVQTMMEAAATPERRLGAIETAVADGKLADVPLKNDVVTRRTRAKLRRDGWQKALTDWTAEVRGGSSSADLIAMGAHLINNAGNSEQCSGEQYVELLTDYSDLLHRAGQSLQAARILKKLSPEGKLYGIQQYVRRINDNRAKSQGKGVDPEEWAKEHDIVVDPALIEAYREATDDAERDEILGQIQQNIADQWDATWLEKLNNWRYLAMLGNFRTQVRNLAGNLGYQIPRLAKEVIRGSLEAAFVDQQNRTTSVVRDRATFKAALEDFKAIRDIILNGGKVDEGADYIRGIESKRRIYKNTLIESWRKATNWAMDEGDALFCRYTYADSLARFMAAHHTTWETASEDLREQGRALAIKEAAEATYRDNSAAAKLVMKLKIKNPTTALEKGASVLVEGVLPFKKTPANILTRSVEYSPIGLVKSGIDAAQKAKGTKDITGADIINELAKGVTGTGLMVLGCVLAKWGNLVGAGPDDEKEKELWELQGNQSYALQFGDRTYTIDWLAPEAIPLLTGANIAEAAMDEDKNFMDGLTNVMMRMLDPVMEMSMMQGINDLMESVGYAESNGVIAVATDAAWSFLMQYVPTLLGQTERAADGVRRATYTEPDSWMSGDMQYKLGQLSQKIPFVWDFNQIPYIDRWGRTEESYASSWGNAFAQFLSPSYQSIVNSGEMEDELLRLYEATGEAAALPPEAGKKFNHDNVTYELTGAEYVVFATARGAAAHDMLVELTHSKTYAGLRDTEKLEAVKQIYDDAAEAAKFEVLTMRGVELTGDTPFDPQSIGLSGGDYRAAQGAASTVKQGLEDVDTGETITNSKGLLIMEQVYGLNLGLQPAEYKKLFEALGVGKNVRGLKESAVRDRLKTMRKNAQ